MDLGIAGNTVKPARSHERHRLFPGPIFEAASRAFKRLLRTTKNEHLFLSTHALELFGGLFFLAGFFTAMNSPPFLLRWVQAVAPPSLVLT